LDGGFNGAKIISEFGIIGILLIFYYMKISRSASRDIIKNTNTTAKLFSCSIILAYAVELFIRGAGYFSSSSIFLIAAFYIFFKCKATNNKLNPSHHLNLNNWGP
jgi:O-antigen/teichoic acid export membrane protein